VPGGHRQGAIILKATNHQKHDAGRHLAVGYALLKGYPAKLVGAQTYVEINGLPAVVMVAGMGAWQIADVEAFGASTHARYILVDVTNGAPDFYIMSGEELRANVGERHAQFMSRVDGKRPRNPDSKHSAIEPSHVRQWQEQWATFEAGS
jgi:hypothetical protein